MVMAQLSRVATVSSDSDNAGEPAIFAVDFSPWRQHRTIDTSCPPCGMESSFRGRNLRGSPRTRRLASGSGLTWRNSALLYAYQPPPPPPDLSTHRAFSSLRLGSSGHPMDGFFPRDSDQIPPPVPGTVTAALVPSRSQTALHRPAPSGFRAGHGPPGHFPIGSGRLGVPVAHSAQANSDPFSSHIPARLRPLGIPAEHTAWRAVSAPSIQSRHMTLTTPSPRQHRRDQDTYCPSACTPQQDKPYCPKVPS
jgi:hypothetical protein